MINLVGLGPGNKEYMIFKAVEVLEDSSLIVGFSRAIDSIDFVDNPKKKVQKLADIVDIIKDNVDKNIAIVASGDPTFYGVLNYLKENLLEEINVVPGLSSFQYLMSKLSLPWNGAKLSSLHGREGEFIEEIKSSKLTIWLTDNKNTPSKLAKDIFEENIEATIYVGENLSYEDEKITIGIPVEIMNKSFSSLSVLVVERK
ncbi:precorrin-6y C5,15-methyltransferase (decarboxylating) subunit CbiE [Clostridium sp. 'White wine YQ']|uniref:precorrin-6y C5,15-methyltransferase (decarboxylating) subunit CbiE n=1 Tax=Clostridium sp. 'White wine YQ' TaxID=3027474 RepID=UPI002366B4FB|nr:precorrin-6y C5,15-methyltransferase (decarboxylating) subunit CbiE [Clostridium sp. 'White wine YQ']MDD7795235.1 precorrin-6y C5,15-methyltransferase (decarboxylating) subunit CbiE [Clostridium sp. 'White wine YQ']